METTPSTSDWLAALRAACHEVHQRIHAASGPAVLTDSLSDYAAYLQKNYVALSPLEHSIRAVAVRLHLAIPPVFDLDKSRWIEQDLTRLQRPLPQISRPSVVPDLRAAADVIGGLYVLEGMAFGGRALLSTLRDRLAIDAENGGRYFSGYGENAMVNWKQFKSFAGQHLTDSRDVDRAAATARNVFEYFEYALSLG